MQLNALDWAVVVASLVVTFIPVAFYYRRSGKNATEFFASGRAAPWWLIGTSMVATTFSTDTPNLVTDFVRSKGVSYNWAWWSFLLTGMMTVFFFARLWRRSGVLTDLEFYEMRYSGKSAAFLRGFRSIYLGLFFNCCIMATVTLAACKIANVMLGWERMQTVLVCSAICIVFGSISGLWGVLTSDLLQFVLAMVGVIAAAFYAVDHPAVGGLSGLLEKIPPETLSVLPPLNDPATLLAVFIIPITVQWWSVWYPGAEPGGGSYIAQRMLAARTEKDALAGSLWFNLAHYALRPWPWIIVALASMIVFPTLADIKKALPHVSDDLIGNDLAYPAMLTLLPNGLLGLLVASLLAAYVSTMTTHMNWGTSYLVMDFYRRFIDRGGPETHYVWLSRGVSALLMVVSASLVFVLTTAGEAFGLLLSVGAGTGLIYLLRWYWWRINAWSEIAAMVASFSSAVALFVAKKNGVAIPDHIALIYSVAATTVVWIVVTFATRPTDHETLLAFCRRVAPPGPGWAKLRAEAGITAAFDSMPMALVGWTSGCVFVYAALFGAGNFLFGQLTAGVICAAACVVSGVVLSRVLSSIWRTSDAAPADR